MSLEQIEWCTGGKALSHRESQGRLCGGCHLRWAIKHGQCLYFKGILGGGNRIRPFIHLFIHLLIHPTSIKRWQWRRHCVWSQTVKSNKTRSLPSGGSAYLKTRRRPVHLYHKLCVRKRRTWNTEGGLESNCGSTWISPWFLFERQWESHIGCWAHCEHNLINTVL